MGSLVSLVRCANEASLVASIEKATNQIGFQPYRKVKTVVIKPNLNYYWEAATGCTTDPRVVGALVDYLREAYGADIDIKVAEADASAMRTNHAFPMLGYTKLAEDKNIELFNLSKDDLKKEKVSVGRRIIEFEVPQSLMTADLFINVPKLKMMRVTKITCAMKNIFGCIGAPRKFVYHPILEEAIVGINKVLKPHLTVVDGLIGLGRFPVKLDLIMASRDVFSIDWTVAKIVGYNPRRVKFLKIARSERVGSPAGAITRGEDMRQFRNKFPGEGLISQRLSWSLQFGLLHLYKKISGDIIPPFLEEE
jgi:uncharacterized protein (DUF362 family)